MTLVIAVEDSSGAVVAAGRGGLQVLAKVKGERYEAIPHEKLFKDEKRTAKAADLALRPLLGGGEGP
jgi:hypothetical protein